MNVTLQWICGFTIGVEITEGLIEDIPIGYCFIDLGILRVQIAWYLEN